MNRLISEAVGGCANKLQIIVTEHERTSLIQKLMRSLAENIFIFHSPLLQYKPQVCSVDGTGVWVSQSAISDCYAQKLVISGHYNYYY